MSEVAEPTSIDRKKLLDRVRKLYQMSRETESSPHEAEIAMRRCQSLMSKFGITEADLETSAFGTSKIRRQFRAVPAYVGVLGSAVALLHDCLCVKGESIEFRGFAIDAEVASLTYEYLIAAMERSLKRRKSDGALAPGRAASFDYRVGFALAVLERCQVIDKERKRAAAMGVERGSAVSGSEGAGQSLVVRKLAAVREACAGDLAPGRRRTIRYRDGAAHHAGSNDGERVSLDDQLSGSVQKQID